MRRIGLILFVGIFILFISLPYILAAASAGDSHVFGGFLINPIDGNSYLAKMEIGRQGNWLFQLPYTADVGEGVFLFLFYIFLGHLSAWSGIEPVLIFHLARVCGAIFLLLVLWRFIEQILSEYDRQVRIGALLLVSFGSGLGWVAVFFGGFTSDFWVAEAYPFLSSYANPHFPIGIAIMLNYFRILTNPTAGIKPIWVALQGILLAVIMPFGVVVAGIVAVIYTGLKWSIDRKFIWQHLVWFFVLGGILLAYQYWIILRDPLLNAWNRQNVTTSAPLGDIILSFSPALILAGYGFIGFLKNKLSPNLLLPAVWLISGLLLAYFPFSLQRRFLLGYFIPVSLFGVVGLWQLARTRVNTFRRLFAVVVLLSIVTNIIIVSGGIIASSKKDLHVYLFNSERDAFHWIEEQRLPGSLVLASVRSGLLIPAYTNWRVLYGHPFETVDAYQRENEIERIFRGKYSEQEIQSFIRQKRIDFVLLGPLDRETNSWRFLGCFPLVFQNEGVRIYSVREIE